MKSLSKLLVLSPVLVAFGCMVPRSQYDRLNTEYHSENQARRTLEDELHRRDSEVGDLRAKYSEKELEATQFEQDATQSKARIAQLESALKEAKAQSAPFGDGVEVVATAEGFAYRIEDQLLFDSGSTAIKQGGKDALASIARQIKEKNYADVRIDGHTDTDPVRKHAKEFPLGNHELALERALAVYSVLVNENKVPSNVLALAAFGPNRPVAKGDSDAAKAKNRRVEINVRVPNKS